MKAAFKEIQNESTIKTAVENVKVPESTTGDRVKFKGDYNPPMDR